jgi:hypothetical protein
VHVLRRQSTRRRFCRIGFAVDRDGGDVQPEAARPDYSHLVYGYIISLCGLLAMESS